MNDTPFLLSSNMVFSYLLTIKTSNNLSLNWHTVNLILYSAWRSISEGDFAAFSYNFSIFFNIFRL